MYRVGTDAPCGHRFGSLYSVVGSILFVVSSGMKVKWCFGAFLYELLITPRLPPDMEEHMGVSRPSVD